MAAADTDNAYRVKSCAALYVLCTDESRKGRIVCDIMVMLLSVTYDNYMLKKELSSGS